MSERPDHKHELDLQETEWVSRRMPVRLPGKAVGPVRKAISIALGLSLVGFGVYTFYSAFFALMSPSGGHIPGAVWMVGVGSSGIGSAILWEDLRALFKRH